MTDTTTTNRTIEDHTRELERGKLPADALVFDDWKSQRRKRPDLQSANTWREAMRLVSPLAQPRAWVWHARDLHYYPLYAYNDTAPAVEIRLSADPSEIPEFFNEVGEMAERIGLRIGAWGGDDDIRGRLYFLVDARVARLLVKAMENGNVG